MTATLTIRDETTFSFGGDDQGYALDVPTEHLTVRELIRTRVYQEVSDYNLRQPEYFRGLVQPAGCGEDLNGFKVPRRRRIIRRSSSKSDRVLLPQRLHGPGQ